MKYYKAPYQVIKGKEILAEPTFITSDPKSLNNQQIKDRIRTYRKDKHPEEFPVEIIFKAFPSQITEEQYKELLKDDTEEDDK